MIFPVLYTTFHLPSGEAKILSENNHLLYLYVLEINTILLSIKVKIKYFFLKLNLIMK